MSRKFRWNATFAGIAALAILLSGSFAKADVVTLTFSGTESGQFEAPNDTTANWGDVSGTVSWNTLTTVTWINAVVESSYGNFNFNGFLNSGGVNNGMLSMQFVQTFGAYSPYVLDITVYSPDIMCCVLPGYLALMNSITSVGITVNYDVSTDASSYSLSPTATSAPAPGALALLSLGLIGLGMSRRRRSRAPSAFQLI